MSTVARLREVLADYFGAAEARTALLRLRERGLLPSGTHGRCGSAEITVQQAALCLFALACHADPKEAPAEAQRIAAFRLLRCDTTHVGEEARSVAYNAGPKVTLLARMANEIEHCDEDHPPSSWDIAAHGACQVAPDRLVFGPSLEALTDPSDVVVRSCRIPGRLLADIGTLFLDHRAEAA